MSERLTIETQSGHFALELDAARVTLRATDKLKAELHDEVASDPDVKAPGFGGRVARLVTGGVQALFEREIGYAVADINTVVYDGQMLRFTYRRKPFVRVVRECA